MVDTSHDQEATPTTQSRDQIGVTPPDHVGMSEAQQRIVDSLQDAGNVHTHCTTCTLSSSLYHSLNFSSPPSPPSSSHLHRLLCLQLNQCRGVNTLSRYSRHPLTLSLIHTPSPLLHHSTSTTLSLPFSLLFAFSALRPPPPGEPSSSCKEESRGSVSVVTM